MLSLCYLNGIITESLSCVQLNNEILLYIVVKFLNLCSSVV